MADSDSIVEGGVRGGSWGVVGGVLGEFFGGNGGSWGGSFGGVFWWGVWGRWGTGRLPRSPSLDMRLAYNCSYLGENNNQSSDSSHNLRFQNDI